MRQIVTQIDSQHGNSVIYGRCARFDHELFITIEGGDGAANEQADILHRKLGRFHSPAIRIAEPAEERLSARSSATC